jgi:hypothetical protein
MLRFSQLALLALLSSALVVTFSPRPLAAADKDQDEKWVKLGERDVSRKADTDDLKVDAKETYGRIKFRVDGPKVHFSKCKVYFHNGENDEINIDKDVSDGADTGPLDVAGTERHITKITIWYKTTGEKHGDAKVSIWGRK